MERKQVKIMPNSSNITKPRLQNNNSRRRSRLLDTKEMKTLCSVDCLFLDGEYIKNKKRMSCETPRKESKIHYDVLKKQMAGGNSDQEGENEDSIMTCVSYGSTSVIGRRRSMEDAVTVAPGLVVVGGYDVYDFFAVYDGHGGARVANACKEMMHQLVAYEVIKKESSSDDDEGIKGFNYWDKVMKECFTKMDDEVTGGGEVGAKVEFSSENTVGSTALVVLVGKEEVVVANCGDSRPVLCRGGVAVALSRDHKPDRPDERQRVEAAGGIVINWNGSRVLGVLGCSRSIGDQYLKPCVTSEPEVTVIKRTESDEFIVIGTDGLWDVISNEYACEVVRKCFRGQIKHTRYLDEYSGSRTAEAAAILAQLAMAKGSKDNISVIVVELKSSK